MTQNLVMKKVVLVKSQSDGPEKYLNELQKSNFIAESIFCIDFQYQNLDIFCDRLKNYELYDGVLVTSPRAAYAVKKAFEKLDVDILNHWISKEFNYSVGESTAKLLEKSLNFSTKGSEAGNAKQLSSKIVDDYAEKSGLKKLLFPCGNLKLDILEKSLSENSIELDIVEVYQTVQHERLEDSIKNLNNVEFMVFFSPSNVTFSLPIFQKLKFDLNHLKVIAIGPSTENCLKNNNIACFGVCDKPSVQSLLKILQKCDI